MIINMFESAPSQICASSPRDVKFMTWLDNHRSQFTTGVVKFGNGKCIEIFEMLISKGLHV